MPKFITHLKNKITIFKQTKFYRVIFNKYVLATFVFLLIVLFLDNNNLIRWGIKYLDVIKQEQVIKQYRRDIKEVDDKLNELTSNKDSIEKFAREQYYFQKDNEEIFILEPSK